MRNSSGLVQSVLGVNNKPSSCCVLVLRGQAEPTAPFDGSVEACARSIRGQNVLLVSGADVLLVCCGIACHPVDVACDCARWLDAGSIIATKSP